ncbi:MAG: acyl-CoA dehydrogenase family protein [Actinomycetota bacterium]
MDFRLNEDQTALQNAAKDFLRKEVPSTVVRAAFEGPDGDSPELYKKMAELGWLGITVPEEKGGLGMTAIEQAVVSEQLGYVNAPGPYFTVACVAIPLLVELDADDLLEPMLEGSLRAALIGHEPHLPRGGVGRAGTSAMVRDGQVADGFIVLRDRAEWYDRSQAEVTPVPSLDGTRRFASVQVSGSGRDLGPASAIEPVQEAATVALCAEMVGGMQWALDETVQYVKDREAFGRPIGVFQAVQHKCADMLVHTESSRSAAYYAAYALANDLPDAKFAVSVAKAYCSDAAHSVTGECIQLHGGIGFTWEHDAHLYFKRATTNRTQLGDAAYHLERVLELDPQRV